MNFRLKKSSGYGVLFRLGLPVLITQLGVIVVGFADTMMVGGYGTSDLAASAFVNSLFLVTVVMLIGFAGGITPLAGASAGRGDLPDVGRILKTGIDVNLRVSLVFTILMGAIYFLLPFMGQPSDLLPKIRPYYLIVLSTLLPMALFNTCQQTANGMGDTALPMWIMIGGNALNIVGNWALIYGHLGMPELGLTGAGLSTMTTRWLMAGAIYLCVRRLRRFRDCRAGMREPVDRAKRRHIWNTSYPVMVQSGVECALWSIGAVVCGWHGAVTLASYQIVNTIGQLGFMIYLSIGVAISVRVANLCGAGNITGVEETARAGLRINILLATAASILFVAAGSWLLSIFTPDEEVRLAGMALILPLVLYQYCDAVQITYANALRGTAKVQPLLIVALVSYILLGVPALFLMSEVLGLSSLGVYLSFSVALLSAAVMLRHYFRRTLNAL